MRISGFGLDYSGTLGNQEGIEYLLDAGRHVVVEKGREDVTFYSRVPDQEMPDGLNTADICVNPDEYNAMNGKSTMNKIMEYMSLEKLIVQFNLVEGRFSAGEASLYVKPNDAIGLLHRRFLTFSMMQHIANGWAPLAGSA